LIAAFIDAVAFDFHYFRHTPVFISFSLHFLYFLLSAISRRYAGRHHAHARAYSVSVSDARYARIRCAHTAKMRDYAAYFAMLMP